MEWPDFITQFPRVKPDFKTLLIVPEWVSAHCIVPDGFRKGEMYEPVPWQLWAFLNAYRVKPTATVGQLAPAFEFRRSQIVLPQKAGKAPHTGSRICVEAVGPALFAGWAKGGEVWDCRDHGCGCGWVYEYQPGEPMGMAWPTPLIQITATSEDQTDNIYSALRPMIDDGPLHDLIPKTGEEFIRLPNDGRIDVVTSNALSRLGQRVTFVPQDETGVWVKTNGMIKVAETQRRGLAGMGGRAEETTNAWDPTEDSVAQRTERAKTGDIFRLHPQHPARGLSYTNKAERRKIHEYVYTGCDWIDLDAIEGEAAEILVEDRAQAERFFGNRLVAGGGPAFDLGAWDALAIKRKAPPRASTIVIGVDGARHDDALAIVACDVKTGFMWPLDIIERPDDAGEDYEHDKDRADGAVRQALEDYMVWRVYCDEHHIEHLIEGWQNDHGEKQIVVWRTNRPRQIAWAVRKFEQSIGAGDLTHPANEILDRHIANARKRPLTVLDDHEKPMHTLGKDSWRSPRKIDGAMAAVLAWEARGDAIASGAVTMTERTPPPEPPPPPTWQPGTALPGSALRVPVEAGPMGGLS